MGRLLKRISQDVFAGLGLNADDLAIALRFQLLAKFGDFSLISTVPCVGVFYTSPSPPPQTVGEGEGDLSSAAVSGHQREVSANLVRSRVQAAAR